MPALLIAPMLFAQSVVLVQGTSSTPNDSERKYAAAMTRNIDRWLNLMDIRHRVITDEQIDRTSLRDVNVALLGYNPQPGERELAELRAFVARGGRLLVFYSASAELAGILDMQLGPYLPPGAPGRWASIRFNQFAPPHMPMAVQQDSTNLRLPLPVQGHSRVIATWFSASGQQAEPAWVASEKGAWMSHVLLDDGDTANKKQMLLALIGHFDPSVWPTASRRFLDQCSRIGAFASFPAAVTALRGIGEPLGTRQHINRLLDQAERVYAEAAACHERGRYGECIDKCLSLRDLLTDAYGYAQTPAHDELRGVWDHSGLGLYPGDWNRTAEILKRNGFTDIFANTLWPWMMHFEGRALPASGGYKLYGDQVRQCIDAAHKQNMKVHAWKVCWKLDGAPAVFIDQMKRKGRLQQTDTGQTLTWLCPSDPANIQSELNGIQELAEHYPIDGIHLDYIRYKDAHTCFCTGCRSRFERDLGRKLARWPGDVLGGEGKNRYTQWRANQITLFVKRVDQVAAAINPNIKISAAVYGKYPQCADSIAQDWGNWLQKGYVDFVCPMNYTNNLAKFTEYTRNQIALPQAAGRIFPGIGVTAQESRLDAVEVIDQINALRREGAGGFVLFDLNHILEREILPVLSRGATADN
jgi:uncharacterized lipoprotein YddW (UPF0748 family)